MIDPKKHEPECGLSLPMMERRIGFMPCDCKIIRIGINRGAERERERGAMKPLDDAIRRVMLEREKPKRRRRKEPR